LLKAFLSADIPLWKLRHIELKKLFESIGHPLPSEQTCRLKIDDLYNEKIANIIEYVKDQSIFLIVDETEIGETKYVNVMVGVLSKPEKALLFECFSLSTSANANIMLRILDDAIRFLNITRFNFNSLNIFLFFINTKK